MKERTVGRTTISFYWGLEIDTQNTNVKIPGKAHLFKVSVADHCNPNNGVFKPVASVNRSPLS